MRQKVRDIREGTEGKHTDLLECVDVGNNQSAEHETNSAKGVVQAGTQRNGSSLDSSGAHSLEGLLKMEFSCL